MGQKTHEKTQKFSPGSGTENSIYSFGNEVRDDFFFSARARTENSIYSFGNEVRDDRVTFPKL